MVSTKYKRIYKLLLFFVGGFLLLVVLGHFLSNSLYVQQLGLKLLKKTLDIELNLQEVKINGLLGKAEGKNLSLVLPKTKTIITLNNVKLRLNPLYLLLGNIHLYELESDGLAIISGEHGKIDSLAERSTVLSNEESELIKLISRLHIDRALIQKISFTSSTKGKLNVESVIIRSTFNILKLSRQLEVNINDISFFGPKSDIFLDALEAKGKLGFSKLKSGKMFPTWDGTLLAHSLFFGLNKTPNPWNDHPAWDSSLDPLIQLHYPAGVPENRTVGYMAKIYLPLSLSPKKLVLQKAQLEIFGGLMAIDASWQNQKLALDIKTPAPFSPSLFPLGKAQFRHVYSQANFSMTANGTLESLTKGNVDGKIQLDLTGNKIAPDGPAMKIMGKLRLKDTALTLSETSLAIGEGLAKIDASIDTISKAIKAKLEATNIPTQTVMRCFSTLNFPAIANVSGTISGPLKNPRFDFDISSQDAVYEILHFGNLSGKLIIENGNLELKGQSLLGETGAGKVELKVNSLFKSALMSMNLTTSFKSMPAGLLMNTELLSGVVDGQLNLQEKNHITNGQGTIQASNLLWFKIPISSLGVDLKFGERELTIKPFSLVFEADTPARTPTKPVVFKFKRESYQFEGELLPGVLVSATHQKSQKGKIDFTLKFPKTDLSFLSPLLDDAVDTMSMAGDFKGVFHTSRPIESDIQGTLSFFEFLAEEKSIQADPKTKISLKNKQLIFERSGFRLGQGTLFLDGPFALEGNSALQIKGQLDLEQLALFIPWLADGIGMGKVDMTFIGSVSEPRWKGGIVLDNVDLNIAGMEYDITEASGSIRFDDKRIVFEKAKLLYDDGPVTLDGWVQWKTPSIEAADLSFSGEDIPFATADSWQSLVDPQMKLVGSGGNLSLIGNVTVVEGMYYKDYSLSDYILKPIGVITDRSPSPLWVAFSKTKLNLDLKSSGAVEIKNNLADLDLKGNLKIEGTIEEPILTGNIDVLDGQIHAFGIDFEGAQGFASFQKNSVSNDKSNNPLIEFSAVHPVQDYEITARIKGYANNLSLQLESIPSLNNNEIISLIAYGRTPDQLSGSDRNIFSTNAIASQVLGLLQRPISKATKLDIVKLETDYTLAEPTPSRFSIGKKLSDRVSLAFTTDLSLEEAQKGVSIEYLILDNILLKGIKDTDTGYRFDLTYRFETF